MRGIIVFFLLIGMTNALPLGGAQTLFASDWAVVSDGAGWGSIGFLGAGPDRLVLGIEIHHTTTPAAAYLEVRDAAGALRATLEGIVQEDSYSISGVAGDERFAFSVPTPLVGGGGWSSSGTDEGCVRGWGLGGTISFSASSFSLALDPGCFADGGAVRGFAAGPITQRALWGRASTVDETSLVERDGAIFRLIGDFDGVAARASLGKAHLAAGVAETIVTTTERWTGFFVAPHSQPGEGLSLSAEGPDGRRSCPCQFVDAPPGTRTFRIEGVEAGIARPVLLAGIDG